MLWDGSGDHEGKVGVHLLMGGANAGHWHLHPECDAVLIGTQDMLISRALNRGYACPRARWPMEYALLNQDALWVMDEVQLMDVGLATSGQLQVFRDTDHGFGKSLRPTATWWMSATLQHDWLNKSPDTVDLAGELGPNTHRIDRANRVGQLWNVAKPLTVVALDDPKPLARRVSQWHQEEGCGKRGPTLVVLNTVGRAVDLWKALRRDKALEAAGTDVRLVHSRFRPAERQTWRREFLDREHCNPGTDRIIVATQVVEAGVDVSAALLVTELAPWPCLVQRFGRCARWGRSGRVVVADLKHETDKRAAPYSVNELDAARDACSRMDDVGPIHLERFEEGSPGMLPLLYPYEPAHLLLRHELDELFDISPDLSGADVDISRFIRSGEERDVQVFWSRVDDGRPSSSLKPVRDELCAVPFLKARDWLCKLGKSDSLKPGVGAWVWDWLDREWRSARRGDLYPGRTVLVECRVGGYRRDSGWDPKSKDPVESVADEEGPQYTTRACWIRDGDTWRPGERRVRCVAPEDHADDGEDDESLSIAAEWQTIAGHGLQVGEVVGYIAERVAPHSTRLLHLAARWHDLGKAHAAFQASIQAEDRPQRHDIAKAPDSAWPCNTRNMYRIDELDHRHGFRHELASTLGLFAVLQRHRPQHEALLGPWREWFDAIGESGLGSTASVRAGLAEPTAIENEILELDAEDFDLVAYLVCAHHGKVRMAWQASPSDQSATDRLLRIRGVREGDVLPPVMLAAADGEPHPLPAASLDLSPAEAGLNPRTGRSWTERVLRLVDRIGPFALALMEASLRAADQRASRHANADRMLLEPEDAHAEQSTAGRGGAMAQAATGGTSAPAPRSDTASRGQLHGNGRRAGGRGVDSGTTRPPYSATRYIETPSGILSYGDLAPLLAERVSDAELAVAVRQFAALPIHELLFELHRRVCADLTPRFAGRWRLRNVRVGTLEPPPYWQVPMLMRNYAEDLEARLEALSRAPRERFIDDLAFAEGRLLNIHPFEDFNGRVCRLFLVELMYRLDLPVIDPAAGSTEATEDYLGALRAYDRSDPRPLADVWRRRFTGESG